MRETRRARARTDEDTSSVRAWRIASCFSAWTAEAVEEEGGSVLLPLRVAVGVIRRDHDVTSRSNCQPRPSPPDLPHRPWRSSQKQTRMRATRGSRGGERRYSRTGGSRAL